MFAQQRYSAGSQIAGDANLQGDCGAAKVVNQTRVFDRTNAVTDAFRADIESVPNALWVRRLAGVTCQPQAAVSSFREEFAIPGRRSLVFESAEPYRDYAVLYVLRGEVKNRRGGFGAP